MKYMTCYIQPFDAQQKICIYDNNICIEEKKVDTSILDEALCALSQEFNIDQIDLSGSNIFCLKIKEKIAHQLKYNMSNTDIVIIE